MKLIRLMRFVYVCCIAVTDVVVFRKLGGNEVRLRHFSLRQVKSPAFLVFTDVHFQKKIPLIWYFIHLFSAVILHCEIVA
jgi:hypothetical protein